MFAKILKANPYHDSRGRFTTKDKAVTSPSTAILEEALKGLSINGVSGGFFLKSEQEAYMKSRGFSDEEVSEFFGVLNGHTKDHSQAESDARIEEALTSGGRLREFLEARADAEEQISEMAAAKLESQREAKKKALLEDLEFEKQYGPYNEEYDGPFDKYASKKTAELDRQYDAVIDNLRNPRVYRRGDADKPVLSTSKYEEGANTQALSDEGVRITPTHSWTKKELEAKGYRMVAGHTALYGYVGEGEVLFIKLPKTPKKSKKSEGLAKILKANPYRDSLGRFTSKDNASLGSGEDHASKVKKAKEAMDKAKEAADKLSAELMEAMDFSKEARRKFAEYDEAYEKAKAEYEALVGKGEKEASKPKDHTPFSPSEAVEYYQNAGYLSVNDYLRGNDVGDREVVAKDAVEKIDSLFSEIDPGPVSTYRGDGAAVSAHLFEKLGVSKELKGLSIRSEDDARNTPPPGGFKSWDDYLTDRLSGAEFEDKGFVSTSKDRKRVMDYFVHGGGRVSEYGGVGLLNIRGKKVKALKVDDYSLMEAGESELLLDRGSKFRIERVRLKFGPGGAYFDYDVEVTQ